MILSLPAFPQSFQVTGALDIHRLTLLFVEKHHIDDVKRVVSHYSLQEDGDEKGAVQNCCDFKLIDPKKAVRQATLLNTYQRI